MKRKLTTLARLATHPVALLCAASLAVSVGIVSQRDEIAEEANWRAWRASFANHQAWPYPMDRAAWRWACRMWNTMPEAKE